MDSHDPEQPTGKSDDSAKKAGGDGTAAPEQKPHVYEFDEFRLDTKNTTDLRLLRSGLPVKISPTQFRLLCIMVENRVENGGRELSTNELVGRVWAGHVVDESNQKEYADNLHHQIQFLREKVGKDNIPHKRNVGYSFKPEVRVIPTPSRPPDYHDFQFTQWLLYSRECLWVKIFFSLGVVLSLTYLIAYMSSDISVWWPDPATVLCLIQFVVVLGALAASPSVFDRSVKEFPRDPVANATLMTSFNYADLKKWADAKASAESSRARYSRYWKLLLFAWMGLYLLLTLALHSKGSFEPSGYMGRDPYHHYWWLSIGATVFNNFNSLAITLCFVVLNLPTVFRQEEPDTSPDRQEEPDTSLKHLARRIIGWGLLAIAVTALVEAVLIYYPRGQSEDSVWFVWLTRANVVWATNLLSGVVGSVTLALYVGRIQSKFLGSSTWLPMAFYLYVAIQSLYVTLLEGEAWSAIIIGAALILKCLLYLYVAWLFKSGRLLYYLVRVKTIYMRVNIEWQDFILNLNRGN